MILKHNLHNFLLNWARKYHTTKGKIYTNKNKIYFLVKYTHLICFLLNVSFNPFVDRRLNQVKF